MKRFTNQVVVITGAANGIGEACARRFAEEGANIICLDVAEEANEETAVACRNLGVEALALRCDVTDEGSVETAVAATMEKWGRIDILVASAGIYTGSPLAKVSKQQWQRTIDCPMKRLAEPWEIAGVIAFLASKDSRYLTGQALEVDGGMVMS